MKIQLKAFAKINLTLDIVGIKPDGYHLLKSIMQSVNLFDRITISTTKKETIEISCNKKDVPCNEKNSCHKAATKFFEYLKNNHIFYNEQTGIKIHIDKNIPTQAGMGGGSSDAAAVLVGLNKMFESKLTQKELISIGKTIGADVAFCIVGGTMLCEGIGDILTPLPNLEHCGIFVAKPNVGVSTPKAYELVDKYPSVSLEKTTKMSENICVQDIVAIAKGLDNDFEKAYSKANKEIIDYSIIENIKNEMIKNGALGSLMTGSGSCVFGIFESYDEARLCEKNWKGDEFICSCMPTDCGVCFE